MINRKIGVIVAACMIQLFVGLNSAGAAGLISENGLIVLKNGIVNSIAGSFANIDPKDAKTFSDEYKTGNSLHGKLVAGKLAANLETHLTNVVFDSSVTDIESGLIGLIKDKPDRQALAKKITAYQSGKIKEALTSNSLFSDFIKEEVAREKFKKAFSTSLDTFLQAAKPFHSILPALTSANTNTDASKAEEKKEAGCGCGKEFEFDAWMTSKLKQCQTELIQQKDDDIKNNKKATCNNSIFNVTKELVKRAKDQDSKWLTFSDYDDYVTGFEFGYEYNAVDKFFKKGNPRLGLNLHRRFFMGRDKEIHISGKFGLTGANEQEFNGITAGTIPEGPRVFEFELQPTFGWMTPNSFTINHRNVDEFVGFTALWASRKADGQSKFSNKHYFGLRHALSHKIYTDVLIGRSSGVAGLRAEIRGQFPVYKINDNSIFYLGGSANMAITNRNISGADAVKVYISWDFPNVFGVLFDKKSESEE